MSGRGRQERGGQGGGERRASGAGPRGRRWDRRREPVGRSEAAESESAGPLSRRGGPTKRGHRASAATGLGLNPLGGGAFALRHPSCVSERRLDYEEGLELWRAGDAEGARDALRYALAGCGDNLWIHVALGRIALEAFADSVLARGHFGYAFELAERVLRRQAGGRLPPDHPDNAPFYEAVAGLAACYEALGRPQEATQLREQARRWSGQGG